MELVAIHLISVNRIAFIISSCLVKLYSVSVISFYFTMTYSERDLSWKQRHYFVIQFKVLKVVL